MAGVSLALRRLLGSRSSVEQAAAFAYAGLAMAGPWLITAAVLVLLAREVDVPSKADARREFQAWVLHAYAVSAVLLGGLQLGAARHVSDRLYRGDARPLVPTFAGLALSSLALHALAAAGLAAVARPSPALAVAGAALMESLGLVGAALVFLGALRRFSLVLLAFALGGGVGLALRWTVFDGPGAEKPLWALAGANLFVFVFVAARLRAEFPSAGGCDYAWLGTLRRHPLLAVTGLAGAAGVWVDKAVHWFGPLSDRTPSGLPISPVYDQAFYLASLTVIPALSLLFVRIEVALHDRSRAFFRAMETGADLETVRRARRDLGRCFQDGLWRLVRLQAPLSLLAVVALPGLLEAVGAGWVQYYPFRLLCVAALLHVLVQAHVLAALHLGLYGLAATTAVAHAAGVAVFTTLALQAGWSYAGVGPVAGALAALALCHPAYRRAIRSLDRRTFLGPATPEPEPAGGPA
jgi:uncharacterized membrane protein